jgi:hypothetical protein
VRRLRILVVGAALATACFVTVHSTAVAVTTPRIVLRTPHAWQVVQRDRDGRADLVVAGRLVGVRGSVRVVWGAVRATVRCGAGGRFVARLEDLPAGQADLEVRSARLPGVVCRRACVGVGDVYVIAGQSNASGRSRTLFTYSSEVLRATLFGNDDRWRELRDPVDSADGQIDGVSRDGVAGGSVWPEVATVLLAQERVPVAFVPCARSNSEIAQWSPRCRARAGRVTLYESLARRVAAVGGRVRAVLWWQGERDARYLTPPSVYRAALERLSEALWRDVRAPMVVAQIGDFDARYSASGIDAVRSAQERAWSRPHIVQGPVLYDIDLENEIHFVAPDDVGLAARRWAAAILGGVLRKGAGATPRLLRAELAAGDAPEIILTADSALAPAADLQGFVVCAAGRSLPVESVSAEGERAIRLTLPSGAEGPYSVSLGEGRSAAGAAVPTDISIWRLPMLPFVARPVIAVEE